MGIFFLTSSRSNESGRFPTILLNFEPFFFGFPMFTMYGSVFAPMTNKIIEAEITNPVFIDPSNERLSA